MTNYVANNVKSQDMSKMLAGISMTMAGIAPSKSNAHDYLRILERMNGEVQAPVDRIVGVLRNFAGGAGVAIDVIRDAKDQWREAVPALRSAFTDADQFAERAPAPRG